MMHFYCKGGETFIKLVNAEKNVTLNPRQLGEIKPGHLHLLTFD